LNTALIKREEELKQEKELTHQVDNSRKSLEQQLKDIQSRVEEAEDFAKRESKSIRNKYENRVRFFLINFQNKIYENDS
jgi:hypothetical protein